MFQASRRSLTRVSSRVLGGICLISFGTATYYRPLPLPDDADEEDSSTRTTCTINIPNRKEATFCSENAPILFNRDETPFFLALSQRLSIGLTTVLIRLFMNTYGEYHITNDEHYHHFLTLVLGGDGRKENHQSLITVSNHRSLFDDPGIVSCLLPLWIGIQPKYNRWGICSQEYCFSNKLPAILKGYIGAGQVLPIQRGAGINQSLFRDFASLVARGEWCHIFPEGGVWQWNELGGRGRFDIMESEARHLQTSKLKWGIGKLVAHAPTRPRVVPFAHAGMENLLPQDPMTRKTHVKKNIIGGDPLKVHIQFGQELYFDDLIQEHESKHGKLWVYEHEHDRDREREREHGKEEGISKGGMGGKHFISSKLEKELYRKIALRIQNHLESLTKNVVLVKEGNE